jgi:hypothetical protein
MIRRTKHLILNALGKGYPEVIYIEPGEDPTKDRQRMISPINFGRIITIVVMVAALCPFSLASASFFFGPKAAANDIAAEGTAESTMEATGEAVLTEEPTAAPVVIVVTATPTATNTPTNTPTPTHTPTTTATIGEAELWKLWMTATQFERDYFQQNQEATDLPYWRVHVVTATPAIEGQ